MALRNQPAFDKLHYHIFYRLRCMKGWCKMRELCVRLAWLGLLGVFLTSINYCTSDNADDDDSDDDDDNDDNDSEGGDDLGLDCESDVMFHRGPSKVELHEPNDDGEMAKYAVYTFEYDGDKRRTTSVVQDWANGEPLSEYERTYSYGDGRPSKLTWDNDDRRWRRRWVYNHDERLSEQIWEAEIEGEWQLLSKEKYVYKDGRPASRRHEYESSSWLDLGFDFELNDDGLLKRVISLDPDNNWAQTNEYTEFEYDDLNRVSKYIEYLGGHQPGQNRPVESTCEYIGDTGLLTKCGSGDGSVTYDWEGDTLTIIEAKEYDGEVTPTHKTVIEFTDDGDSSYYQDALGTQFYNWIMFEYGNGVINGCIGR